MNFIGTRDGNNTYEFLCPSCEAEGELGVRPNERAVIQCPNKCGALFMQQRATGMFAKPRLEYVAGGQIQDVQPTK